MYCTNTGKMFQRYGSRLNSISVEGFAVLIQTAMGISAVEAASPTIQKGEKGTGG
jgi:hypothetical protein